MTKVKISYSDEEIKMKSSDREIKMELPEDVFLSASLNEKQLDNSEETEV